jgi:ABC-type glycerol-3-phosphate transport system substrate-binding protein
MSAYFPVALLDVQHRGKTYGLPYCSAPRYYMCNAEHVAEAGLTNPNPHWNRETFLTYARKLTKNDGYRTIRWGTTDRILSRTSVWPWLRGAGGELVDETNRQFRLGEAAAVEALQWVADLHLVYGVVAGISANRRDPFPRTIQDHSLLSLGLIGHLHGRPLT